MDDISKPYERAASGDIERGLVLFAGGLRFFGVRWGRWSLPQGLRRAGFGGRVVYWPWHGRWTGPFLTVPALRDRQLHEAQASAIARCVERYRRDWPGRPVYVMGCSAGGWVALRALELLGQGVTVDGAALFSAAVWPGHDLTAALSHVRGVLVNTFSVLDCLILGLGTLVFGTGDGRHSISAGMTGFKTERPGEGSLPPADAPPRKQGQEQPPTCGRLVNLRWRPGMIATGKLGGHVTATPPMFVARHVAPLLGITANSSPAS